MIGIAAFATLAAIGALTAGGAMIRWPKGPLDFELPPARAGGLPALPGQSALACVVMTVLGIATALVGMCFGLIAFLAAAGGLLGLPGRGKLVVLAAITSGAVIASRLHARRIRQPA